MRHERDAAISHAFHLVFGLIRLARRLIGPVPGARVARHVRADIRAIVRLGEALYRRAVLLIAADLDVRPGPLRPSTRRGRSSQTPRALPLLDPPSPCHRTGMAPDPGRFGGRDEDVALGQLPARLERLARAFTDPVARARRLALWRARARHRRARLRALRVLPGLAKWHDLPALRQSAGWVERLTRETVFAPP